MSLQGESFQKFVGKPLRDLYGRYVGYVVGLSLDPLGQIDSIAVDQGREGLIEYPSRQVVIDLEALNLVPSWRVETDAYRKEGNVTYKRLQALEELVKTGEIPVYVYEEQAQRYKEGLSKLQESFANISDKLKKKASDLEGYTRNLERFFGNVKVQHKTGEMNDATYKVASENLVFEIDSSNKERKDILNAIDNMGSPSPETIPFSVSSDTSVRISAPTGTSDFSPMDVLKTNEKHEAEKPEALLVKIDET